MEQTNMIEQLCVAHKSGYMSEQTRDNIERADRIAKTTNKSSFMGLGERQPNLVSEQ